MPFKSVDQLVYLKKNKPEVFRKFVKHSGGKSKASHSAKKMGSKYSEALKGY